MLGEAILGMLPASMLGEADLGNPATMREAIEAFLMTLTERSENIIREVERLEGGKGEVVVGCVVGLSSKRGRSLV
jgi:hypothetical protein